MTTAPAVDERRHSAAVIAVIQAAFTALDPTWTANVFDFGEVPGQDENSGTVPDMFVALQIERRFVPNTRMVALASRSSWRISARYVGRTVNNARLAALAVTDALDGTRLTVDAATSTPVLLENTTSIQPDDGMFSGSSQWTYTC
jgi:hypothetical protein